MDVSFDRKRGLLAASAVIAADEWGRFAAARLGDIPVRKPWLQIGAEGTSIHQLREHFPDDDAVLRHVFKVRFGPDYPCPRCGRKTTWRRAVPTRVHKAGCCRRHALNPLTDTLFDRTRIPLRRWLELMLFFADARTGVTVDFAKKLIGVGERAAFKVVDRIRQHIALLEAGRMLGGPGEPVHIAFKMLKGVRSHGGAGGETATVILANDRRYVVAMPVSDRRTTTIAAFVQRHIRPQSVLVYPDEVGRRRLCGYGRNRTISSNFEIEPVSLFPGLPDLAEGYWLGFRRIVRATHIHIRRENVWKYVNEFSFRFNRVHRSHEVFWDMVCHYPALRDDGVR